jgi:hypothetical protein
MARNIEESDITELEGAEHSKKLGWPTELHLKGGWGRGRSLRENCLQVMMLEVVQTDGQRPTEVS